MSRSGRTAPTHASPPDHASRRDRRLRRLGTVLLFGAVVVFIGVTVWAVASPKVAYQWPLSMLSDLGASDCFVTDGRAICSPRADVFNLGLIAAGATLLGVPVALRRAWGPILRAAVGCAAVGLLLLGLFPSDTAHRAHMTGAVLALPVASALLLISAVRKEQTTPSDPSAGARTSALRLGLRSVLAGISLLATVVHLFPQWRVRGAAEMVSLVTLLAALVIEACVVASIRRPAGGAGGGSEPTHPDGESSARPQPNRRPAGGSAASAIRRRRTDRATHD